MANEYKTIECKLNGKQSISIPIDIKRNGKLLSESVDIVVRGFLKFEDSSTETDGESAPNALTDKTVIYPVLFSTDRIAVTNGHCVITLLPRSEDLFEDSDTLQERMSSTVKDSEIESSGGIRADEQITEPDRNPVVIRIDAGQIRRPYKISVQVTVFSSDGTIHTQTVDRGVSPQLEDTTAVASLFQKQKTRIASNLVVDYYNDEEWIPTVTDVLATNSSTRAQVVEELAKLKNHTPFGLSTMYDAVVSAADMLSDNSVDAYKKTIYVFTDNEANTSIYTLDETIDKVNAIDAYRQVPVLVGNLNVVEPATLSVRANSSDTRNLNKMAALTDGQSVTVNSDAYLDDISKIFYGEAVGSLGYGTYEFVTDLGEEALINQVAASFDIPNDTATASWKMETSSNGYTFTTLDKTYNHNETVSFENLYARYIKFIITLVTGFSSGEDPYGSYPQSPALTGVQIVYNKAKVAYLYLAPETVTVRPYQMTLGLDANDVNDGQILVGVAKSDSHNWADYHLDSQPSVTQNGKVVIPLRFSQNMAEFQQEPLNKVDRFTLKTEHGGWDPFATVTLYDSTETVISSDRYTVDPRSGLVILNFALPSDYTDGDYRIGILNSNKYKVGLKLTNKSNGTPIRLYGIGYVYTTGKDLLPPLTKAAPEAQEVELGNASPHRFSEISVSYTYFDTNFDEEDVSKRRIRWYINGKPISYLENLTSWNDLDDPDDPLYVHTSLTYPSTTDLAGDSIETWAKKQGASILNANDTVYCEVQVTDGTLYSNWTKSDVALVVESTPVLAPISIKSLNVATNELTTRLTAENYAVLDPPIDEAFFADSDVNSSEIVWYVNDEVFKRGYYGQGAHAGDSSLIHRIGINEVGKENFVDIALRMGNVVFCQVTPRTGTTVGTTITTPSITVMNALPKIENLAWVGNNFKAGKDLMLAWNFFDFETFALKDVDITQQRDQTTVRLYRKNPGKSFELAYVYNDHSQTPSVRETYYISDYSLSRPISVNFGTGITVSESSRVTISGSILKVVGQQWYAEIMPHDSIEYGTTVQSDVVTITAS
jgi:hypothetical protein